MDATQLRRLKTGRRMERAIDFSQNEKASANHGKEEPGIPKNHLPKMAKWESQ